MKFTQRQRGDIQRAFAANVPSAAVDAFIAQAEQAAFDFHATYTAPSPAKPTRNEIRRRRAEALIEALGRYYPRAADAARKALPNTVIHKQQRGRPTADAVPHEFVRNVYLAYLEAVNWCDTARGFQQVLEAVSKAACISVSRYVRKAACASVRADASLLGELRPEK